MEEIYANVDLVQPVCQIPVTNNKGSGSCNKRRYVGVIISIGFLNVFLLVGLISLGVHSHALGSLATHLTETKDNLQDSNDHLSANLTEMSNEMIKLQTLLKKHRTCPAGWRMFSFSCYLISTTTGSWDEGREDCKNKGGDLVVIDNNEEQTFVSKFTEKSAWIGLNDKETEGSWKWVDGTSLNFKHWANNGPDNGNGESRWGEEDCVHTTTNEEAKWNDLSCNTSMQWLCEKEPTLQLDQC